MKGDDLPTVNFESFIAAPTSFGGVGQSFDEGILGIVSAGGKYGGAWDAGVNSLDDPPGLYPRDDLADVDFYISRTSLDDTFWTFAYQRLRGCACSAEVKSLVSFDVNYQNQGQFIMPTGSV